MKIFIDSADLDEIAELNSYGIIDGVTTNPSSIAKMQQNLLQQNLLSHIKDITKIIHGPISVQVTEENYEKILVQGNTILEISDNIVLKLPLTWDGIKACKYFSNIGKNVNMTLCFNATQALLAAKVGATYVSPFIGRIDDIGYDGVKLIEDIRIIFNNYKLSTKILAASIRNVNHIYKIALIGVDIVTASYSTLKQMIYNPLTDQGLYRFNQDWLKSRIKI